MAKKKSDIIKEIVIASSSDGAVVFDSLNEKSLSHLEKLLKVIKLL